MTRALTYLTQPEVRAVDLYRLADRLLRTGHPGLARIVATVNRVVCGVEIEPGARIGKGLIIYHGNGIVVGSGADIGERCVLLQQVTIGLRSPSWEPGRDEYPTIGDDVVIYAGARVLGPIRIGDGSVIGANCVVTEDVPDHSVAFANPAIVRPRRDTEHPFTPPPSAI